jgi:hypothetical protein
MLLLYTSMSLQLQQTASLHNTSYLNPPNQQDGAKRKSRSTDVHLSGGRLHDRSHERGKELAAELNDETSTPKAAKSTKKTTTSTGKKRGSKSLAIQCFLDHADNSHLHRDGHRERGRRWSPADSVQEGQG